MDLSEYLNIADRIVRSFTDDLSVKEKEELQQWREQSVENEKLYQEIVSLKGLQRVEEEKAMFLSTASWKAFHKQVYGGRVLRRQLLKYAALLIPFGLAVGMWLYRTVPDSVDSRMQETVVGVWPSVKHGGPKAMLVLNDGSQVNLNRQATFTTGDATVENTGNSGTISYKKKEERENDVVKMNKLIVPNGGEYNIELSDGTKVYLNAASELTYPVSFSGNVRKVSLKGEAYFKVTHDEACPFVVQTEGIEVKVLGTEFNLNAYEGQKYAATTLVTGQVEVQAKGCAPVVLKPDQQARFDRENSRMECMKVNTLPYVAWKNGKFVFYHERLEQITAMLERWYDVEFCYEGEGMKGIEIFGIISRYEDINKVLNLLSSTRLVGFEYREGKICVVPYAEN